MYCKPSHSLLLFLTYESVPGCIPCVSHTKDMRVLIFHVKQLLKRRLNTLIPTQREKSWIFLEKNSPFERWKFSKALVIFHHAITPMRYSKARHYHLTQLYAKDHDHAPVCQGIIGNPRRTYIKCSLESVRSSSGMTLK